MTSGRHAILLRASAIAVPVLLFLTLVAWAFASPVGSSPDDNFHLPSIWCGMGERDGLCELSGDDATRMVPTPITTATCYAFLPTESAECWVPDTQGMSEAEWMNAIGLYPPVFYLTMSLFASSDVSTAVVIMRIVNSAIVVGVLSAVFFALPRRLKPALLLSTLVTSVPLGLFVLASTNPSSWALVSAATVWISLYGATVTTGRRRWVLCGLAVLGTIMGAGARADAAVFAVFAVVIVAVLSLRRRRDLLIPAVTGGLVVVVSVALYLSTGQSGALASGLPTTNPPLTGSQHLANLLGVPILWFGAFGASGLGWLDTVPPATVTTLGFGVFCAAVFIGIHRLSRRRAIAVALAFAALWGVPFILLAQSRALVGTEVQSRYLLPLMVILVGVASAAPRIASAWRGPRAIVAGAAVTAAMSIALHTNIRRYTVGVESNAIDPGAGAEWWWTVGPAPLAVWVGGTVAFAVAMVLLIVLLRYPDGDLSTDTSVAVPHAVAKPAEERTDLRHPVALAKEDL